MVKGIEMKVIEFTGNPGSGKTALYKALYTSMKKNNFCVDSDDITKILGFKRKNKIIKYLMLIIYIFKEPNHAKPFIHIFIAQKKYSWHNFRFLINAMEHFYIGLLIKNEYEKVDYIIYDSGILHKLWSSTKYGELIDRAYFDSLVNEISMHLTIINIEVKVGKRISIERMQKRLNKTSIFDHLSSNDMLNALTSNETQLEKMQNAINKNKNILKVKLNGLNSINYNTNIILNEINYKTLG